MRSATTREACSGHTRIDALSLRRLSAPRGNTADPNKELYAGQLRLRPGEYTLTDTDNGAHAAREREARRLRLRPGEYTLTDTDTGAHAAKERGREREREGCVRETEREEGQGGIEPTSSTRRNTHPPQRERVEDPHHE